MQLKRRPRLLYLSYPFRPAQAIACVRTWNTAKHLSSLGWDVTVVTPHPSLWRYPEDLEKTEAKLQSAGLRRISTGCAWSMLAPSELRWHEGRLAWILGGVSRRVAQFFELESQIGWLYSVKRACAHLKPGDVDIILATAKPNITFRIARWLGRRLNRPFVLDYRDPWTGDPHVNQDIAPRHRREEAQLLEDSAAVTVVSPSWAELIGSTFGVRDKVQVISNGYDPDMFVGIQPKHFDHFAIVYAGTLYPPKRVLDPVLQAFRAFITQHPDLPMKFHYYGNYKESVEESARRIGVTDQVISHGMVSRSEALSAQKGAGLVIVVATVEDDGSLSENGMVTGKIFDCIALSRPALVVAPRGSDLYTVTDTTGGACCFTGSDVDGMASFMAEVAKGYIPQFRNPTAYHWANISKKLDSLLRSLL